MDNNKLYPCNECGKLVKIRSKGLCPGCRYEQRKKEGSLIVYNNPIKPITEKTKKKRIEERSCLSLFFQLNIEKLKKYPYSMESKERIFEPSALNICHILPKRKDGGFPSVQCDMRNVIYLTWQEHSNFDKYLDERDFSKLEYFFPISWKLVINILNSLLDNCRERNKMYFDIKEYLNSNNCKLFLENK